MILAWLIYCVLVATLLGIAALAGESALRSAGRPVRGAWAVALAGSLAVPAWAWLAPPAPAPVAPVEAMPVAVDAVPLLVELSASADSIGVDRVLGAAWLLATVVLTALLLLSHGRLGVARRRWGRAEVDGVPVYLSSELGPAAMGFFRGTIVVPRWTLALERRLRRLMVLHEREHLQAGDPRLIWLGLLAVAVMPWNPAVWWQLRRLRLAIEFDCDARVLARDSDARSYGRLLLEVGRRRSAGGLVAAALAEPRSYLERRIRMMLRPKTRAGIAKTVLLGAGTAALVVLACEAPEPVALEEELEPSASIDGADGPLTFTADEIILRSRPLTGGDDCSPVVVLDGVILHDVALRGGDASPLDELGPDAIERIEIVKGRAAQSFEVEERVAAAVGPRLRCGVIQITTKAGNERRKVEEAAGEYEVKGAVRASGGRSNTGGTFVEREVGVTLPSAVEAPASTGRAARERRIVANETLRRADARGYAPMTPDMVRPRLRNQSEVQRALQDYYPPLLRDAGIGGVVDVMFWIDETGAVSRYEVAESSHYPILDEAATRVAETMEFTAAQSDGSPVPVVVSIPIRFRTQ